MPLVEITLVDGREPHTLRTLLHEVQGAVTRSLSVPDQSVRIVLRVIPKEHWCAGGVTYAEREQQAATGATT